MTTDAATHADMRLRLDEAVKRYDALSPVDRALHDDEQRRSWVYGMTGRRPPPDMLADEVRRIRAQSTGTRQQLPTGTETLSKAEAQD